MGKISEEELAKSFYLDPRAIKVGRLSVMPFWDGVEWHLWIETSSGNLIRTRPSEAGHANYVAKQPAADTDINIWFIEYLWQRANWPEVSRASRGIEDDFHLLATSVAKLNHFYLTRDKIDNILISSFVKSELEYIVTVARSVFDLLQEAIAAIWNKRIRLENPIHDALKRRHKLPDSFTKMAIQGRDTPRSVSDLVEKYAISPVLAEQYYQVAPFYISLLKIRDKIIHGGSSTESVFSTEKGFCVNPNAPTFSGFEWKEEHYYNENLASLLPWIAHIVARTVQACNDTLSAFVFGIDMPPEVAPGFHVFIRDPANSALLQLLNTTNGSVIWWSDTLE